MLERGTKDGYNTAVVEFLDDDIPSGDLLQGGHRVLVLFVSLFTGKLYLVYRVYLMLKIVLIFISKVPNQVFIHGNTICA